MARGDKTIDTYKKTAAYYERQAKRDWASAKNNLDEGYKFKLAREKYEKARSIREAGEKRFGEK